MSMAEKKERTCHNQCYDCKFRGGVPGSAHSSCNFNWAESEKEPPQADAHGKRSGWYIFPWNFDPVWQETMCEAFEEK